MGGRARRWLRARRFFCLYRRPSCRGVCSDSSMGCGCWRRSSLATLFVSIMPETVGQLDPALFAGAATAYFPYSVISVGSIRRRTPDIVLQTWTGVFADVLVLSLLTYASGGVNGGIAALVVLSIGAASFILRRRLAMAIAVAAALAMLIQPGITLLATTDAMGDFTTAADLRRLDHRHRARHLAAGARDAAERRTRPPARRRPTASSANCIALSPSTCGKACWWSTTRTRSP